jgi:hypothetical protein
MMRSQRVSGIVGLGLLAAGLCVQAPKLRAQAPATTAPGSAVSIDQPDAGRTKEELARLLERYPPTLRAIFALDPTLLTNQAYMAPYPALVNFLNAHPEIARNPAYFVGRYLDRNFIADRATQMGEMWRDVFGGLAVFGGFGMAIGLLTWLIRTLLDYRRWNRLSKVQTEVHTKLLDRFTASDELLSYIQSPAGSKFLESAPISLDAGPRSMGAPLGRILWSIQAGFVLAAAGVGLQIAAGQITDDAAQPLHVLGIVGMALGAGFAASAGISFAISHRLGLIESTGARVERPGPDTRA